MQVQHANSSLYVPLEVPDTDIARKELVNFGFLPVRLILFLCRPSVPFGRWFAHVMCVHVA